MRPTEQEQSPLSEPNLQSYHHDQVGRTGVLLVNLGTPDAPDRVSVRRYLKEFLFDEAQVRAPVRSEPERTPAATTLGVARKQDGSRPDQVRTERS